MNAFVETSKIGDRGVELVMPFLKETSLDGQVVTTDKGRLSEELQKKYGDIFFNCRNSKVWAVEVKTEESQRTGNFFLETWSNKKWYTPGWMIELNADILVYLFLDTLTLYSVPFKKLQRWSFDERSRHGLMGRLYDYPEREMKKYGQPNDTWGRCVPIVDIENEVGFRRYKHKDGAWNTDDEPIPTLEQTNQGIFF